MMFFYYIYRKESTHHVGRSRFKRCREQLLDAVLYLVAEWR